MNRTKPVKAAIIVFGDRLEVIHDPQLVTETEAAITLIAGQMRLGVVSVYYEGDKDIEPYLARTRTFCQKLDTKNLILAGDVNAWSHWWGSRSENQRGEAYSSFLGDMDFQVLNKGDTPTFETYRGGKLYSSIVDVTACSLPLLGRIENWRVERSLTTSDHNAIVFALRLDNQPEQIRPKTTRRYNTKKAKWLDFSTNFKTSLAEKNITPEVVKEVELPENLEALLGIYIESIQESCKIAIPERGLWKGKAKPPWWSKDLEELKIILLRK